MTRHRNRKEPSSEQHRIQSLASNNNIFVTSAHCTSALPPPNSPFPTALPPPSYHTDSCLPGEQFTHTIWPFISPFPPLPLTPHTPAHTFLYMSNPPSQFENCSDLLYLVSIPMTDLTLQRTHTQIRKPQLWLPVPLPTPCACRWVGDYTHDIALTPTFACSWFDWWLIYITHTHTHLPYSPTTCHLPFLHSLPQFLWVIGCRAIYTPLRSGPLTHTQWFFPELPPPHHPTAVPHLIQSVFNLPHYPFLFATPAFRPFKGKRNSETIGTLKSMAWRNEHASRSIYPVIGYFWKTFWQT